ncbi:MAG TPA: hypothetical protein VIN08_27180 [Ohtaekwangia sp.]|uniref:RHS repeat domain-containing protein n=1 Tax=Ohtaekwangia sp. TaxID=2066019 RepID=UPI002F93BCF4
MHHRIIASISLLIFFTLLAPELFAQVRPVTQSYDLKIIPPSPNAATFHKYGDIPVSYYTGVPSIEIPLYQITDKELSTPISLSYHAGGIRASEESGTVGLGWTLQCGGIISQSIKDKNDFKNFLSLSEIKENLSKNILTVNSNPTGRYFYGQTSNNSYDMSPLYDGSPEGFDTEIDVFNFNFGGRSGKFILDQAGQPVLDRYADIKIIPNIVNEVCDKFTIIDEHGIKYIFQDVERENTSQQITSWYLTSVTAPSGASIVYHYLSSTITGQPYTNEVVSWGCDNARTTSTISQAREYTALQVSRIDFRNGYVEMNYDDLREDLAGGKRMNSLKVYSVTNAAPVKEFDFVYTHFNDGSTLSNRKRLKLDQLIEKAGEITLPPYIFNYKVKNSQGGNLVNFPKDSKAIDHWGFNNGKFNSTLVPKYTGVIYNIPAGTQSYQTFTGADREVDPPSAQAFILTDLTYPTGGKTLFEYESNTYDKTLSRSSYANDFETTYLEDHTEYVTIPLTGSVVAGTFTGAIDCSSKVGTDVKVTFTFKANSDAERASLHSSSNISATAFGYTRSFTNTSLSCGGPVCTTEVNVQATNGMHPWQVEIGTVTGLAGVTMNFTWKVARTVASSSNSYDNAGGLRIRKITNLDENGNAVSVKTYDYHYQEDKNNNGVPETYSYGRRMSPPIYTRYEATTQQVNPGGDEGPVSWPTQCFNFVRYANSIGALSSSVQGNIVGYDKVTEYIASTTDNTQTLGKTVYEYENTSDLVLDYTYVVGDVSGGMQLPYRKPGMLNLGYSKNGLLKRKTDYAFVNGQSQMVKQVINDYQTVAESFYYSLAYESLPTTNVGLAYEVEAYPALHSEKILLMSTTEKNPEATTKTYTYGSTQHIFPTQTDITRSDGRTTTIKQYYTSDSYPGLSATAQSAKTEMVNQHILSPVIATESTTGTSVEVVKSNYKLYNTTMPLLESVETKQNAGNFDLRYNYLDYDVQANLRGQSKPGDVPSAYVWGYSDTYIIAEAKNALPDQIFHTSFEETGNSAWDDAKTGHKSKTDGYSSLLTKLTAGKYILSWWSKPVAGAWQLQQQTITVTGTSYTINLTGQVDEVRFYPVGALMTTYTYDPLVGLKSVTDPNQRLLKYEYDDLGRLVLIRDNDDNIIKKYTYNYQQR